MAENQNDIFGDLSEQAYAEVAERHPVGPDTPTRVNRDGTVVNMTREAMLDRLHTFGGKVNRQLFHPEEGE